MATPTTHVISGPDLYCAGPLVLGEFRNILAKYRRGPKKALPSERMPIALCHLVNPSQIITLRL